MSSSATIQRSVQKPCGCSSGASCGCRNKNAITDSNFLRPNFFAGQLLTDEDLRDAMDYMVQKNRLHNRHLVGEGVVCGLQVDPHPCPEYKHKVIVRKGHAINGCGDDIVVVKDHEIDIVEMASELLKEKRGFGCDDPCRDRKSSESDLARLRKELLELRIDRQLAMDKAEIAVIEARIYEKDRGLVALEEQYSSTTTDEAERRLIEASIEKMRTELQHLHTQRRIATDNTQLAAIEAKILAKHNEIANATRQSTPVVYGLYVNYSERQSDFVTPYQTDSCSTTRCKGSRIREGYEFELRCQESRTYPDIKRVTDECADVIPDFKAIQGTTLHAICTLETVEKVVTQFKALESLFPPMYETPRQELRKELKKVIEGVKIKLSDTFIPPESSATHRIKPDTQRNAIEAVHQLVTLSFRSFALSAITDELKVELEKVLDMTESDPSDATEPKLATKCKLLVHVESVQSGLKGVSGGMIDLLVNRLLYLKKLLVSLKENPEDFKVTFDVQASSVGELIRADLVFATLKTLNSNNKRLLSLMASGSVAFVPELRSAMYQVQLGESGVSEDLTNSTRFNELKKQAQIVNRAVSEVTRQCMCRAVLPPVPTDSSSSVLIADITVNDCEVVEICNLARRFVIAGPSLRYWFSEFNGIFGSLRQSCCPDDDSLSLIRVGEESRLAHLQREWQSRVGATTVIPIVETVYDPNKDDYADNLSSWERLHAAAIPESSRVAVTPTAQVVDALSAFREFIDPTTHERRNNHQQEMSRVLAQMATRPDTDLRNLLAWSESFTSPAEVMKVAKDAREQAATATSKISAVESTVVTAKQIAEFAKTAADGANAKTILVDTKADTAQTAADNARTAADGANAKAILAETKADAAQAAADNARTAADNADAKAIAADTKADAAQTAADNAKTAADKAVINAGAAETKADEAKALAQTAQFDHDNVPGTPDRTVQDVVQIIRTELNNGGTWNIARITSLLQTIVNG